MYISVLQENLQAGMNIVKGVASNRYSLPVLSNVLLASDNGRLKLTVTDLELSISVWIGAKVEQEGAITLPAKVFAELVSNLSPERVDLELNTRDYTVHLASGVTKVKIKGISADEFPVMQGVENGVNITMPGDALREMIAEVSASAAKVDNRPVLTSIYTNFEGEVVTMASADGYRLTVRKGTAYTTVSEPLTALIPVRTLQVVGKLIGKGKKTIPFVTLKFDTTQHRVVFELGDIEIVSNLMEEVFPEYERIVPKSAETTTIVYRDELLRACKKAAVFAKDSSNTTRLNIVPSADGGPGTVMVSAKSLEMGEIESDVDALITGEGVNAAYNVEYLLDTFKAIAEDQVVLETTDFASPLVIRAHGRTNLYYVVMPMNVGK